MLRHLTWLLFIVLMAPPSWALEALPNLLKDWQGWVLEDAAQQFCPRALDSEHTECIWPGELTLAATDKGAEFKLAVDVFAPNWVDLPGGPGFWPIEVKLGSNWIPVRQSDERPQVYLPKGRHLLTGRFSWASLPRILAVPEALGIVHLSLNGKPVEQPSLEAAGSLWLAEQAAGEEAQSDSLSLKVFRKLSDGIPLVLTSRLELEVSGAEREVVLGPWLLAGFTPRAFSSDLPAKLEANGALRVQIKPGQWTLILTAHSLNPQPSLTLPAASEDWPGQEVWSFEAAPRLRTVQVSGGASLDPSQTTMPEEWRTLPAYLLEPGQGLVLEELFRGNPNPAKDELRLVRSVWLDFSGAGLTFSDSITGSMKQSDRLDLAKPFELLKADVNGKAQVVTQVLEGSAGVELREAHLQLEGQGRLPMARELPVSAWAAEMSAVSWQLALPPGWSLFYARGADSASGAWVTLWGLFDIFIVLIIVIALGKIVRPWVGALAFVCLLITYQRSGAAVFSWLNLAAVLALLPWVSGAFARWLKRYAWLSFASLLLVLLSFSITHVRYALYPQLEGSTDRRGGLLEGVFGGGAVFQNISQAKTETTKAHMASLKTALQSYRLDNLTYPTTEQGLQALVTKPTSEPVPRKWRADGYMERIPLDPWDRPYFYTMPGAGHPFDIVSLGADGQPGGEGADADISYWDGPVPAVQSAPMAMAKVDSIEAEDMGRFPDNSRNEEVVVTGMRASLQRVAEVKRKSYDLPSASQQIDPSQQTQTGPGKPSWQHATVYLNWSGPVTAEQTTRLYWVPPWINRPGFLLAAFLPWLLAFALWQASGLLRLPTPKLSGNRALGLMLLALAVSLGGAAPDSLADEAVPTSSLRSTEPSPELLKELKTRLLKAPLCLPDCVSIEAVSLQVKDDNLRLELVLHALAPSIYALPASQTSWWPQLALLNGERASLRQADDELQLALLPGRQSLVLQGNLAGRNALPLAFGLNINNLKTELSGWSLSGEPTAAAASDTLQLSRAQSASSHADKRLTPAPMAPFVRIERTLQLGLEWAIETQVTRIAPVSGPIHLEVPLLSGEAPLGAQPNAQGLMSVNLANDETSFSWTSRLKIVPQLNLTAPEQPSWVEEWQLEAAPQWHIQAEGVPQLGSNLAPRWQPWPAEQLRIRVGKPPAIKGNNLTLQTVELSQNVGQKAQDVTLSLSILSNQGQDFLLTLPADAKLNSVTRDGGELPPIMQDGRVKLPVKPGSQVFAVQWQHSQALPLRLSTAPLDLGAPARNISLRVNLPQDRWILLLGGPQMGPALLFWGVLCVVLGLAWALGRSGLAHLKSYEWVLLSLGVATQNLSVLVILAAWFAALRWRGGQSGWAGGGYKALQVGLVCLSLLALGLLLGGIPQGLLSTPDMHIVPASYGGLAWYSDYTAGPLPEAWVVSVPMWVYRVSMLLWSLWIAFALMRWLKWGWQQLNAGGFWPADKPAQLPSEPDIANQP